MLPFALRLRWRLVGGFGVVQRAHFALSLRQRRRVVAQMLQPRAEAHRIRLLHDQRAIPVWQPRQIRLRHLPHYRERRQTARYESPGAHYRPQQSRVARGRWLAFELDDVFLPCGMAIDLFTPRPRRLAARQLELGMLDGVFADIPRLFVDAAERAAGDTLHRVADARAERRTHPKSVHLRARFQQPDDLEF